MDTLFSSHFISFIYIISFAVSGICKRCRVHWPAAGTTSVVVVSPVCTLIFYYFSTIAALVGTWKSWKHDAPLVVRHSDHSIHKQVWTRSVLVGKWNNFYLLHLVRSRGAHERMWAASGVLKPLLGALIGALPLFSSPLCPQLREDRKKK